MQKFKLKPNKIFNIDETDVSTDQAECLRTKCSKGSLDCYSTERERIITVVFAMNVAGNYISLC